MASKEALEKLINKTGIINDTCAHLLACVKCGKCKFEEPIETCADYQLVMTIEKDLEVLEILKKHYDKDSLIVSLGEFIIFCITKDDKDFNKIKDWLEND